jgi:membrane-associated protease RseP (regulator of RpoE activity)
VLITLGVVAFVVALLLSVTLHEAGHFFTARRYGMKATQFFVGFGPTLWSRRRGETEYGVKAIPAGGFVKIVGMTPLEELDPADSDRAFYKQPAGRKAVVLAAGSTVHFIIAVLLVFGVTWGVGVVDRDAPILSSPTACLPVSLSINDGPRDPDADPCDPRTTVPAPAAQAGLQAGDKVLAVDGKPIGTYREFVRAVRSHDGGPMALRVQRDDQQVDLSLTPTKVFRPDLDDPRDTVQASAIGVAQRFTTERVGFTEVFPATGQTLEDMVVGTYKALTTKLATVKDVYSENRDREGVVGVVGVSRISAEVAASEEETSIKVLQFVLIIAGLNLFVGVFNLLPLLPLDGGHIAVVAFEQLRDRVRRLRGHVGELQRVDYNKLLPLTYGVALLFIVFTVFIAGADIVNPIRLDQ